MNSIVLPPFILGEDEIEDEVVGISWEREKVS
jgi:hypothetical protein